MPGTTLKKISEQIEVVKVRLVFEYFKRKHGKNTTNYLPSTQLKVISNKAQGWVEADLV